MARHLGDVRAAALRRARALARAPLDLDAVADVERRAARAGVTPEVTVRAREPEVGDAEVAVLGDEQVGGLEIAVDHAVRMDEREAARELERAAAARFGSGGYTGGRGHKTTPSGAMGSKPQKAEPKKNHPLARA